MSHWVSLSDNVLDWPLDSEFLSNWFLEDIILLDWSNLVDLVMSIDVVGHWDVDPLFDRNRVFDDVVDELLDDVLDIHRALNDMLDRLFDNFFCEHLDRNWSLDDIVDVNRSFDYVFDRFFNDLLNRNLDNLLNNVVDVHRALD